MPEIYNHRLESSALIDKLTDQSYLQKDQYRTESNLQARIQLHKKYGTNPYPWQRWVYDQLSLQPEMRILELGCGPGELWVLNSDRTISSDRTPTYRLFLSDYSTGMVVRARQQIPHARYLCLDAQAISFTDNVFDIVIANHMLYHLPDLEQGIDEIYRVIRPGGWLAAATNGTEHMLEINNLLAEFDPHSQIHATGIRSFSIETGGRVLSRLFSQIDFRRYEDNLHVTDSRALIAYIRSLWDAPDDSENNIYPQMSDRVDRVIQNKGYFPITKSQGLFLAMKNV